MFAHHKWMALLLALQAPVWSQENPRHIDLGPGLTAVKTLEQHWTDEESNRFYNIPQGSRLIPYDWFLHLEQASSRESFRDAKHIRALGYIPRKPDGENPDGLPIGFISDAPYDDGTEGLGITCAACHTSQINRNGTAYLIDGGPAMGDFESFLKELAAALKSTADDETKFGRFAAAVLPASSSDANKVTLRNKLRAHAEERTKYNERNLPKEAKDRFGHGRVDAFGAIFNEVSVTFLKVPGNWHAANAPVSYPCLWDAPQHDRVQWNGAAENRESRLGPLLFDTELVGALGRNSGEVLGVFGSVEIDEQDLPFPLLVALPLPLPIPLPKPYQSSVKSQNLKEIESSLTNLWSPEWPPALGSIDTDLEAKGKALYSVHCAECHVCIDRQADGRKIVAKISNVDTDPMVNNNFGRKGKTGHLEGRLLTLVGSEPLAAEEPISKILKHVVGRVIFNPTITPAAIRELGGLRGLRGLRAAMRDDPRKALELLDKLDNLTPGYRMTATIEAGDQKLVGQFDAVTREGTSVKIDGGQFHLMEIGRNVLAQGLGNNAIDVRNPQSLVALARELHDQPTVSGSVTKLPNATAKIGYKARPLNGVWATAPYLHNGSVPNLVELLKPASERVKSFHVGSQEYDVENVGFKNDPSYPLFDTKEKGNSNQGHEYGASLSNDERRQLLEYLKSL